MGRILRMILLPLMLVSILSLPIALGCNGDTSGEFSQLELEQLLTDSALFVNDVDSYKTTMDMEIFMDMSGRGEEGTMDMDMTMEGAIDQKNMEISMIMAISMSMDIGFESVSEDMTMDMYMVGDYIYLKMDIPELGEEWIKMPATDEAMSTYDFDIVNQQLTVLESPGDVTFLRYENVDGGECYVIELVPDMATMMEWIGEQGLTDLGLSWEDVGVISDMFDELTYTIWIDKETKYMKKMTAYILMKFSGDTFEDLTGESGSLTMDIDMDMEMYDYNEPVTVVLPEEALDAMEFGDFDF